ncbi:hypothetical protein JNB_11029 [Janibacter sp. HTCC2649]|nr:hypothetical protein JNB_11029 [Janibacter sp. HTCC2649]
MTVDDLGPAVLNFSLAAGIPVGNDKVFVASRNIEPMRIVGYDLTTEKVTSITPCPGISTQMLAADPAGHYVYSAIREYATAPGPGFIRLDLSKPGAPKEDLAAIPGLDPYAITVSPDGVVYFGGQERGPKLRQYDPETGQLTVVATPDPNVPMIRSLAATEDTVYIGTGAVQGVTPTSTKAGLFALNRATGEVRSILPPQFAGKVEIRELEIMGDELLVHCRGGAYAALAFIKLADPTQQRVIEGTGGRMPKKLGDKLYWSGSGGVREYSLTDGSSRLITPAGLDVGELWGLWIRDGKVMVVSAYGLIIEIDPVTTQGKIYDLVAGGAPVGPQLAMSVAAGAKAVYVGGNNAVARHDLTSGKQSRILAPGEAKDTLIRDGVAYFAQYSGAGILAFDPTVDDRWARKVASSYPNQNRPHQIVWDDVNRVAVVGFRSDTLEGGSVMTFDPATNVTTNAVNPIDARQMVRAVVCHEGVAYLGGQTTDNRGGTLVAWDPISQRELWRLTPQSAPTGITGLAVRGDHLYVMCFGGDFFVVDLIARQIVHRGNHGSVVPDYGTLLVSRGQVYGASSKAFFRFDTQTFARTDLVPDLNGEWYGIPRAAVDERGQFYAIKGRNLVRITVSPSRR